MWEIGDKISYLTFNGRRDAVIVKIMDKDRYLCRLPDGTHVVVNSESFIF